MWLRDKYKKDSKIIYFTSNIIYGWRNGYVKIFLEENVTTPEL